jgi:tetratricopeptide (TPR) repeat protein
MGDTKNKEKETIANVEYEVHTYPSKKLYFDGDRLSFWQQTEYAIDNMLELSKQAYEKAIELDENGKLTKKIKEGLTVLAQRFRTEGINALTAQKHKEAQKDFMGAVDCGMNPIVGTLDSIIAYYAGIMSINEEVKDYDNAIKYFKLCMDNQFYDNGNVFTNLALAYAGKGDAKMQEEVLREGFTKVPSSQSILIELINLYLGKGEDPTAVIPYLEKAQENEPTNATLFFAEATLYEKLQRFDDAERMYVKTIEVDPTFYNAYYNLGALYYNKGVEYIKEADGIKNWKDPKIKELEEAANVQFKKSIEPFLKAHELQPDDKYALENVKNLYFRFRNESKEMMDKYNEYNEKLKELSEKLDQQAQ